ncbi:MAG: HAD-IIIC family phosphatase [Parasporobacterium sp.]|nr:HAD-IIIC family phosphatase [Parasporobacterium sp.]
MKELLYPFDSSYIMSKKKSIKRQLLSDGRDRFTKRIAILGGSTTDDIMKVLELFLLDSGIAPEFYQCEYAQYEQEALFPCEELINFRPELIFIHTSGRNLRQAPELTDSREAVDAKLLAEFNRFKAIWTSLKDTFHCPIIQNNFESPFFRIMGNKDISDFRGLSRFISRLNNLFAEYAEENENFYISDLNYAAADFGLRKWADPYYWNMYKYCMCPEAIPAFAYSVSHIIKALWGRNKKALALDLDNTLWGGVVGDDGVTGIEIGQENGVSQSYYEFQNYISRLKPLGILLTVCSKNDEENAIDGLNHPEGVLKPADFVVIKANWENKDRNISQIAAELNILPESIVFVDDNPAERGIVEAQLPGVIAPVMDSVENYIANIDRNGFFETVSLNADDMNRNEMYRENAMRAAAQAAFSDYGEYLTSLNMEAEIEDFTPLYIQRITQLTNKSNQFNLTTRRYTPDEMEAVYNSTEHIRLYGKLIDKFGDNGVVSVVIGRKDAGVLHVELWLMSCRVLKRDMEQAMLDRLVEKCRAEGISTIRGYYYPTKKNGMVKELYKTFGFTLVSQSDDGSTVWEMPVEGYTDQNKYITVK